MEDVQGRPALGSHCDWREVYDGGMLKYSIVVPFHNEEDNVTTLYDRLKGRDGASDGGLAGHV